jgi:secreted Zn-dependent insulinase-like peptidase
MPDVDVNVTKPPDDKKFYRLIRLPNGIRALLVQERLTAAGATPSSADSHKAAVAVTVGGGAGSFADPAWRQGLAHFLEHDLFCGSEKHPGENEYDSYLSANGGSANAFTENESTTYECDVNPDALEGALDRVAAFFAAPLFRPSLVSREVRAIESEFAQSRSSDSARGGQILCHSAAPRHPYNNFGWGNYRSLLGWEKESAAGGGTSGSGTAKSDGGGPPPPPTPAPSSSSSSSSSIIEDLRTFHAKAYDTRRMHLVVRGDGRALAAHVAPFVWPPGPSPRMAPRMTAAAAAGLDALEAAVRATFGTIPASVGGDDAEGPASSAAPAPAPAPSSTAPRLPGPLETIATLRELYGVADRSHARGDRAYTRPAAGASSGFSLAPCSVRGPSAEAFAGGARGTVILSPLIVRRSTAPSSSSPQSDDHYPFTPLAHFFRSRTNKHTLNLSWALPPLPDWYRQRPESLVGHVLGHEGTGTILHHLRAAGLALSLSAGVGSGGTDSCGACMLFVIKVGCTPLGLSRWREVVTVVSSYVVHVLCGGVNAAAAAVPVPPEEWDVASGSPAPRGGLSLPPSALLAAAEAAALASSSAAAAAAAPPVAGCPFAHPSAPPAFATLAGYAVPSRVLSALHTVCSSLAWAQAETAQTARLEYAHGDEGDALEATVDASLSMAALGAPDEDVLLAAANMLGSPIVSDADADADADGGEDGASSSSSSAAYPSPAHLPPALRRALRRDGFVPALVAYIAAHLTPANLRVDISTPLVGDGPGADEDPVLRLPITTFVAEKRDDDEEEEEGGEEGSEDEDEDGMSGEDEGSFDDEEDEDGDEDGSEGSDGDDGGPDGGPGGLLSSAPAVPDGPPPTFLTPHERSLAERREEPWFGTPYVLVPIDPATVRAWAFPPTPAELVAAAAAAAAVTPAPASSLLPLLTLPTPNAFIPTDLGLKPIAAPTATAAPAQTLPVEAAPLVTASPAQTLPVEVARVAFAPSPTNPSRLVRVTSPLQTASTATSGAGAAASAPSSSASPSPAPLVLGRLWHKQDGTFRTPRTALYASLHLPALAWDPLLVVASEVWMSLAYEDLTPTTYAAECAGLSASLHPSRWGFDVEVSGFTHRARALLASVLASFSLSPPTGDAEGSGVAHGAEVDAAVPAYALSAERFARWRDYRGRLYANSLLAVGELGSLERSRILHVGTGEEGYAWERRMGILGSGPAGEKTAPDPALTPEWMLAVLGVRPAAAEGAATASSSSSSSAAAAATTAPAPTFGSMWAATPARPVVVDVFVHGNEDIASAEAYLHTIVAPVAAAVGRWLGALPAAAAAATAATPSPVSPSPLAPLAPLYPSRPHLRIPHGQTITRVVPSFSPDEVNGLTLIHHQAGLDGIHHPHQQQQPPSSSSSSPPTSSSERARLRAYADLLEDLLSEPFFDVLRTKEQLGYEVYICRGLSEGAGVVDLHCGIKSATHPPHEVRGRIEAFFAKFRDELVDKCTCGSDDGEAEEGEAKGGKTGKGKGKGGGKGKKGAGASAASAAPRTCPFDDRIRSLIARKLRAEGSLSDEAYGHWREVRHGRVAFGRAREEADELTRLLSPRAAAAAAAAAVVTTGAAGAAAVPSPGGVSTHPGHALIVDLYDRLLLQVPAAPPSGSAGSGAGAGAGKGKGVKRPAAASAPPAASAAGPSGGIAVGGRLVVQVVGRAAPWAAAALAAADAAQSSETGAGGAGKKPRGAAATKGSSAGKKGAGAGASGIAAGGMETFLPGPPSSVYAWHRTLRDPSSAQVEVGPEEAPPLAAPFAVFPPAYGRG